MDLPGSERRVEATVRHGLGEAALVHERFAGAVDSQGCGDRHHLQLSLLPMPGVASASYVGAWGDGRYERLGNLFLLPARATLRVRSECRRQYSVVCRLDPERVDAWLDGAWGGASGGSPLWTDRRLAASLDIADEPARRLLRRIERELRAPGFAGEALVELLVGQACIELARHFRALDAGPAPGGLAGWRLRRVEETLRDAPGEASLASLAALCGLSTRHLARSYKASRGRSLAETIAERRLQLARRMLAEGAGVKQAAFAAGFSAPTNFAAAFRRATGQSPRGYRDACRRGGVRS